MKGILLQDVRGKTAGFVLKNNEDLLTLAEEQQEHCGACQGHCHG